MVTVSQETKDRISTENAPAPPFSLDQNIGKVATMKSGPYAGLKGILYPKADGVYYAISDDKLAEGQARTSNKQYLLLFFYDDGKLFCGVPVDPTDVTIEGGYTEPPGEGTPLDPIPCDKALHLYKNGTYTFYHSLPPTAGNVKIYVIRYGGGDGNIEVYFANNPSQLVAKSKGTYYTEELTFYYDPAFNGDKIIVKAFVDNRCSNCEFEYILNCP